MKKNFLALSLLGFFLLGNSNIIAAKVIPGIDSSYEKEQESSKAADAAGDSVNIAANETKPKEFLSEKKIKVKKRYSKWIGHEWNEKSDKFNLVQGFCTDGKFWYVALVTSDGGDKTYKNQVTKLLKIDIKKKKVVLSKNVGKIGHSNSLAYNPDTDRIYTATCTDTMCYCYSFKASDFKGKKTHYFKDSKGKKYTDRNFPSVAYDPIGKQFVVKMGGETVGLFELVNKDLKLKKKVKVDKDLKIEGDVKDKNGKVIKKSPYTGQALSCDGTNIFSVCTKFGSPNENYILCYDMKGKFLKKYTFVTQLSKTDKHPEMEQVACINGKYWCLSNLDFSGYNGKKNYKSEGHRKMRIHRLTLKG